VGGDATFSGTNYQANVIAYAAVHVLTETKLRWLNAPDDTPTAIAGEVKGPGDDARLEFAQHPPVEIQAKHGLRGGAGLTEIITRIRDSAVSPDSLVILAVESSSSSPVRVDLRRDLERLRSGRTDGLQAITQKLIGDLGDAVLPALRRLRVVVLDVDAAHDNESKVAQQLLAENIEDPSRAESAWAILRADGNEVCAQRLRRTRTDLIALLAAAGIRVLPSRKTRRWHDDLRHSKAFLADHEPASALALLARIEADVVTGSPDAEILYRLHQHKGAAYLGLRKFANAIESAERALLYKTDGLPGLITLANAQALGGLPDDARRTVGIARTHHPDAAGAWLIAAQVAAIVGDPIPQPPPHVAAMSEYRRGAVAISLFLRQAALAREQVAALLADGDRSPEVVLLRVESLLEDLDDVDIRERLDRAREIERLCTELVESPTRISEAALRQALVARSQARRALGRMADAQADTDRARITSPDDPAVIAAVTQAKLLQGDGDGALAELNRAAVEENLHLLAMRAGLLAARNAEAAKKDLESLVRKLTDLPPQPNNLYSAVAEAAIQVQDTELAKEMLSRTSEAYRAAGHYLVLQGRLAWADGNRKQAEESYRKASEQLPDHKPELLAELGVKLIQAGETGAGVALFKELDRLPPGSERHFVKALIALDQLNDAHSLIRVIAARGSLPDWAVACAAEIAHRRNDPEVAARYLGELVAKDRATPEGRLVLIETLLHLGQSAEAEVHIEELGRDSELEPRERMLLAQILVRVGKSNEAIAQALVAYREAPGNPEINRAFTGVILMSDTPATEVDAVGPDTYVLLRHESGSERRYIIFAEPSSQHIEHEITLETATAIGLVGLRVNDVFREHADTWMEKRWSVVEIEPATKYLFNDVLQNYPARFPLEPFFVAGFKVSPDATSLSDLQPLIAVAHDTDRRSTRVLSMYREQVLPLGVVAKQAGRTIPELMSYIAHSAGPWPLYVEWWDDAGVAVSLEAARLASPVVLTRSALYTLEETGILPLLVDTGRRLMAPRSLQELLQKELTEAQEREKEGWTSVGKGPLGVAFHKLEPGDQVLVRYRGARQELLEWTQKHVEYQPRPLEAFGAGGIPDALRHTLGDADSDALELAKHSSAVLYADDSGLKRVAVADELKLRSISTVTLLHVLTENGILPAERRDQLLVDLAERHYNAIRATPEMLLVAMARQSATAVRATFSLLAAPSTDPTDAARTVSGAVRLIATSGIQTTPAHLVIRHGLAAMALKFEPRICAQMLSEVADEDLRLLPTYLQTVVRLCQEFVRRPWAL
jgi:tetratricopeptide (TPR) repeat protein